MSQGKTVFAPHRRILTRLPTSLRRFRMSHDRHIFAGRSQVRPLQTRRHHLPSGSPPYPALSRAEAHTALGTTTQQQNAREIRACGAMRRSCAPQVFYFTVAFNAASSQHPRSSDARSPVELFENWIPPPKASLGPSAARTAKAASTKTSTLALRAGRRPHPLGKCEPQPR